jgi:hypothetical protein
MSDYSEGTEAESSEGGTGEVTAEELQQIQSPEEITERTSSYFQPDYDKVADDDSYAESGDGGDY